MKDERACRSRGVARGRMRRGRLRSCLVSSVGAQPPPLRRINAQRASAHPSISRASGAVITEDWRWRMATPPVGDSASIPLNAKGVAATKADFEKDRAESGFARPLDRPA